MKFTFAVICLILSFSISAQAEYRAFLLEVKDTNGTVVRTFKSSLDPDQYRAFYPLKDGESLSYIDTWMCQGRTGNFQPICTSPREVMGDAERMPASAPGK
jgi:hypothetical protein